MFFFSFIHAAHVFDKMLTWIIININIMGFVVSYLLALKLLFFYDFVFLNFLFCVVFLLIFFLGINFVVRSDAKVNQVLKSGAVRKHELLIPNAVAVCYLITQN
jgi:hypothetical protein